MPHGLVRSSESRKRKERKQKKKKMIRRDTSCLCRISYICFYCAACQVDHWEPQENAAHSKHSHCQQPRGESCARYTSYVVAGPIIEQDNMRQNLNGSEEHRQHSSRHTGKSGLCSGNAFGHGRRCSRQEHSFVRVRGDVAPLRAFCIVVSNRTVKRRIAPSQAWILFTRDEPPKPELAISVV